MGKKNRMILVTGGAGYIGSHTIRALVKKKFSVVVLDNLVNGHQEYVPKEVIFIKGDVGNKKELDSLFKKYNFDGVIHFAAFAYVRESIINPLKYFENNVKRGIVLFEIMSKYNVKKIVFSSSCSVYGVPKKIPISENEKKNPLSPYGKSKLFLESMLSDLDRAEGIRHVVLRYFNAAGAMPDGTLGENHLPETHIIPLLFQAVEKKKKFHIFGKNFPTRDGTAIRDYIHVCDLADAHVKAIEHLIKGKESIQINLGTGQGISILELINLVQKITKTKLSYDFYPANKGDAPELIASWKKAEKVLNWKPIYSINEMVKHAWNWEQLKKLNSK